MMIKPELAKKLIEQVRNEFAASLQYLAIAIYFEQQAMNNTAAFFYAQAEEENEHGMKLLRYVVETGGTAELLAIPAPVAKIKSAEDAFQTSLNWELEVTGQINALMAMAKQQNDYLAENFLQWFVNEQLEEVTTIEKFLNLVRKMGDKNIYMLEQLIKRAD
ncbi:MAG: ferritin [Chloroflexi bacterium HGW-Chloroflexi-3]|nr:MAG: ferritin [Chloroflexi bacterium HGW-Chloroflexi-3]